MSRLNIKSFLFDNHEKWMTIRAYIYSAYYRAVVRFTPQNKMEWMMGVKGEETPIEIPKEKIRIIKLVSFHVNRITMHTPWESKCLVRALTAARLLKEHNLPSTLYLGVGTPEGKMVGHAWLRCGPIYVTGGNGDGYAQVAKFRK